MNRRIVIASITLLLICSAFSCKYVMPERYVDYNKGRVPVNLPRNAGQAEMDRNAERSNAVIVTVTSDGKTYLGTDHSPIDNEHLRFELRELAANQPEDERMVYLAADVAADYGRVVEACDAIRTADVSRVGVMVFSPRYDFPARLTVELPAQPDPNQDFSQLKPNPLTLVVSVSADLKLKLNQDDYGTVNDLAPLSTKLMNIFRDRRDNRAYRRGFETATNVPEDERVEKTITIKANRSIKFGDVAKVVDALRGTGAKPIILQLDDLPN